MNSFKSHFKFSKQERSGIFFLLLIIVALQVSYLVYSKAVNNHSAKLLKVDEATQAQIDALKKSASQKGTLVIYPFNPNYITDYKGYTLGLSVIEIDRLHQFRAADKFINSVQDFQKVTLVSDSLLDKISPYFKFPNWVKKAKTSNSLLVQDSEGSFKTNVVHVKDINLATALELKEVNGVGDKLSARIVKFRDRLGGFVDDEQVSEVYGLEPAVVQRITKKFKVLIPPLINKINVNTASASEMAQLVYLNYTVSKAIVVYREENKGIHSFEELKNIEGFPSEKINRISLYLLL
ncbi:helix-hairpin-helix domain-containing protein [Cellulophaga sp. HaHa_2_95]|uniref:ComEA family DNA-binding protein n=1 Tax=Cellulophaga sp. HaHa_2_95 TaxID=2745558 RepID=UPI001C4EC28B|nr:helix-hairpin-helix domain-containing protein [Cellulophaga sp. HaHa_2_95]QXP55819.1 helix-hairpin-helix domain-containing protein [Cellulophaga sp. HaHa_2_95]